MWSCSTSSTVTSSGMLTVLRDRPADEGLDRSHHPDVPVVVDGVVAHRAGEHGQVLGRQVRRADDRLVLVDVGDDLVDLIRAVAELAQGPRHGLVDDRHRSAADQLLGLDQTEVRLDPGGVAVHEQADRAGRCQHRRLRVAHAVLLRQLDRLVPRLLGGREQLRRDERPRRSSPPRAWCMRSTFSIGSVFSWKPANGPMRAGGAGRRGVGVAGHEGSDGRRPGPAGVRVVGQALRPSTARRGWRSRCPSSRKRACVLADLLGRVVGVADDDLLAGEHDRDRGLEAFDVEVVVFRPGIRASSRRPDCRLSCRDECTLSSCGQLPHPPRTSGSEARRGCT